MSWESEEEIEKKNKFYQALFADVKGLLDYWELCRQRTGSSVSEHEKELQRRGIGSGFDEALHDLSKEVSLELMREDPEVMQLFREYVKRWLRERFIQGLKGNFGEAVDNDPSFG